MSHDPNDSQAGFPVEPADQPRGLREDDPHWIHMLKLAELGVTSSSLLHELRQPLFALKGYLQLLVSEGGGERPSDPRLERCLRLVNDMEQMASSFLDFSRVTEAKRIPLDVRAPVEAALGLLSGRFRRAKVELRLDLPSDLPVILGNPLTLQQVLVNMLGNAIDALTERDELPPRCIWVVAQRHSEGGVRLLVADNGTGIDPALAEQIFNYFFTTKPEGKGTGLGLAISASIVAAHGGLLRLIPTPSEPWVPEELSPRTVFELLLPGRKPLR